MAGPLQSLRRAMGKHDAVHAAIIHPKVASPAPIRTVAPQVEALDVQEFLDALAVKTARQRKRREA